MLISVSFHEGIITYLSGDDFFLVHFVTIMSKTAVNANGSFCKGIYIYFFFISSE